MSLLLHAFKCLPAQSRIFLASRHVSLMTATCSSVLISISNGFGPTTPVNA